MEIDKYLSFYNSTEFRKLVKGSMLPEMSLCVGMVPHCWALGMSLQDGFYLGEAS